MPNAPPDLEPPAARVRADYTAQYPDPLSLHAGEAFALTGREDLWQGRHLWLWGLAGDGRAGWVPAAWVERRGAAGVCRRAYSARELSVRAGDQVTLLTLESGWAWCADAQGEHGWVPAECLA